MDWSGLVARRAVSGLGWVESQAWGRAVLALYLDAAIDGGFWDDIEPPV